MRMARDRGAGTYSRVVHWSLPDSGKQLMTAAAQASSSHQLSRLVNPRRVMTRSRDGTTSTIWRS